MRRLAQFVRLRASRVSRLSASASVSRLRAFVSRASRVCVHLSRVRLASVCVCSRQGFRMRASASVSRLVSRLVSLLRASVSRLSCICLRLSVSRRSSCLASRVCVRLSRVCLASVVLSRVCLSILVNACGNWLILCRSSFKEFKRFFAIVILSYNVPMPKYPSHHLIYVFYHPMPIMPLY